MICILCHLGDDINAANKEFWPTITKGGIVYNLLILEKVTESKNLSKIKSIFDDIWNTEWDNLANDKLLYFIDMRIFDEFASNIVEDFVRFTPSTVTLLQQNPDTKELTPIAVQVSKPGANPINYKSTDNAWLYALQAAKTSITVFGIWLGHVYHWHIVSGALIETMKDTIKEGEHLIRKLIDPQSESLRPFTQILIDLWSEIVPPTSFSTSGQFMELINKYAVEEYVQVFVNTTYADDNTVKNDTKLQDWIHAASDSDNGNVQGLTTGVTTKQSLQSFLTSFVYRLTIHGAGRLVSTSNPYVTFVSNFPPCLQSTDIPSRETSMPIKTLLGYLPKTGTIGEMVTFMNIFTFSKPSSKSGTIIPLSGNENSDLFFPGGESDPRNQALIEFRKKIQAFIETHSPDSPPGLEQIYQWPLCIET